jgi:hypothetical protein
MPRTFVGDYLQGCLEFDRVPSASALNDLSSVACWWGGGATCISPPLEKPAAAQPADPLSKSEDKTAWLWELCAEVLERLAKGRQ